jgi:hypothetical protein
VRLLNTISDMRFRFGAKAEYGLHSFTFCRSKRKTVTHHNQCHSS